MFTIAFKTTSASARVHYFSSAVLVQSPRPSETRQSRLTGQERAFENKSSPTTLGALQQRYVHAPWCEDIYRTQRICQPRQSWQTPGSGFRSAGCQTLPASNVPVNARICVWPMFWITSKELVMDDVATREQKAPRCRAIRGQSCWCLSDRG